MNYEEIPNKELFMQEWTRFTEAGRAIPDGVEVVPTEWAYQNGVVPRMDNHRYIKVRNSKEELIIVLRDKNQQGNPYWAGFWKENPALQNPNG